MLPKNLVLDEVVNPKNFDELLELLDKTYRVEHEQTSLESISIRPDGTVQTPSAELQLTRSFLEDSAKAIAIPLSYAYKVSPVLFCENFAHRRTETTVPVTISRVGQVATGLIIDRKSRYRPASTSQVLQSIRRTTNLSLRRASVSLAGVDVELVSPSFVVEPVEGDVLEVGIAITNSESGGRQLKASAYSYRLACTNGAIMADKLGAVRWPNDPRMTEAGCLRAFETGMAELHDKLDAVSALYKRTLEVQIPDVELWRLWRRVAYLLPAKAADEALGMSEDERRTLHAQVRERNLMDPPALSEQNAYDTHNRITFAAHGRPFRIRRGLQEIGGDLLSRAATWPPVPSAN
jgi:Domain of unknown function (DUF932)